MAKWFIRDENNIESGPFSAGEMRRKVNDGEVSASTMVRKDKNDKFLAAKSYKGLIKEGDEAPKKPKVELDIDSDMPTQLEVETKPKDDGPKLDLDTKTTLPNGAQTEAASFTTESLSAETQDTEAMSHEAKGPETVRTEMLKTDATRKQFASSTGTAWLLRLTNVYLVLGALVTVGFIVVAAGM